MTIVYHTYRTSCATVRQPPGFGDFLRGSIALAILAPDKPFSLRLDFADHPIGRFLRDRPRLDRPSGEVHEFFNDRMQLLPPFLEGLGPDAAVAVTTHLQPDMSRFTDDARRLVLSQLAFDESIEAAAESLARGISEDGFAILHVRVADGVNGVDPAEKRGLIRYISRRLTPRWGRRVAVISNATPLKREISDICGLPLIDTRTVHLGECTGTDIDVRDTLVDFALLSRASEIHSWSNYAWKSGFSSWCACLHGIPFVEASLEPTVTERIGRALRARLRPLAAAIGLARR